MTTVSSFCRLNYTITLTTRALKLDLDVENRDEKRMDFTCALHTYYSVPDVSAVRVVGLRGLRYADKTDGGREKEEAAEELRIDGFTDRVYKGAPQSCVLRGLAEGRALMLTKVGLP